jgi:DNA uptake protein ComE-like DNA-binding protein
MNLNTEPIKNWFGFTRRERRSTFSLLLIIVIILIIRYSIPDNNAVLEIVASENDQSVFKNDSTKSADVKAKVNNTRGINKQKFSAIYTKYQTGSRRSGKATDINLSDTAELMRLPGIGSVLSVRIIKYRKYLGGFARIEQLKEVYGLSAETYDLIKSRVTADSTFIQRIDINTADYKELSHIRYLDKYEISAILKYRELKGRISKISDLVDNKLITMEKAGKVGAYIRFE